jgi:hypothetical protein
MTTKPPLQNILNRIPHTEDEKQKPKQKNLMNVRELKNLRRRADK